MVYLLYGTESVFKDIELDKIKKESHITNIDINQYDGDTALLEDIIIDANTISLFQVNKLIIVDNFSLFMTNSKKNIQDTDINRLESYLKNMNPNTQLVFLSDKVNQLKKGTKLVKKYGVLKDCNNCVNLNSLCKQLFEGYTISNSTINLLLSKLGKNVSLLKTEVEKLKLYKMNELVITDDDIEEMVTKNINLDIFNLIDNIINNNKDKALESYFEMLKYNEEPIKIIIMLANQFRLMYQAKSLIKQGYSEDAIAKQLDAHPYSVKLALQKSRNYETDKLLSLLDKLAEVDYQIKSGKMNKELALELFIIAL